MVLLYGFHQSVSCPSLEDSQALLVSFQIIDSHSIAWKSSSSRLRQVKRQAKRQNRESHNKTSMDLQEFQRLDIPNFLWYASGYIVPHEISSRGSTNTQRELLTITGKKKKKETTY